MDLESAINVYTYIPGIRCVVINGVFLSLKKKKNKKKKKKWHPTWGSNPRPSD